MALLIAVVCVRVCTRRNIFLKFECCVKGDTEMPQILSLHREPPIKPDASLIFFLFPYTEILLLRHAFPN